MIIPQPFPFVNPFLRSFLKKFAVFSCPLSSALLRFRSLGVPVHYIISFRFCQGLFSFFSATDSNLATLGAGSDERTGLQERKKHSDWSASFRTAMLLTELPLPCHRLASGRCSAAWHRTHAHSLRSVPGAMSVRVTKNEKSTPIGVLRSW